MENLSLEEQLLSPEEREQISYIWDMIPSEDKEGLQRQTILRVLDAMDDYLEEEGLLKVEEETGEITYLDGDVDETEQMAYVLKALEEEGLSLSHVQLQLIMDAELQYGIQQGWYEEE